jgi:hypothetical protein
MLLIIVREQCPYFANKSGSRIPTFLIIVREQNPYVANNSQGAVSLRC